MEESRVYLFKTATSQLVEASLLDEVIDRHLTMWSGSWSAAMQAHCAGRVLRDKPEDHHWDWKWKASEWRPMLGYHSFAITCEGELQGLMLVSDLKSARIPAQFGRPIVYVEFLATAPWNRPEIQTPPRYRGVGTVMVAAALELSWQLGYHGRIGLHSLPAAEKFYRDTCKMSELGKDTAHQGLMYYEMTDKQAEAFRLNHQTSEESMKLERAREWYARRIALEGDVEIGAGAPPCYPMPAGKEVCAKPVDTRIAFGTFVELWRRNRGWDAVKLAEAAGVNPEEILEIEHSPQSEPEPNAVYRLAGVFNMPEKILMELAGLIESRTPNLRQAAVRFAARSESVAELNPQEREAFEAFVSAIAETAQK